MFERHPKFFFLVRKFCTWFTWFLSCCCCCFPIKICETSFGERVLYGAVCIFILGKKRHHLPVLKYPLQEACRVSYRETESLFLEQEKGVFT